MTQAKDFTSDEMGFANLLLLPDTINLATIELKKVSRYKTPRDKLICLVNACKLISGMVSEQAKLQSMATGADDILPPFVYTMIKANNEELLSDLNFIR